MNIYGRDQEIFNLQRTFAERCFLHTFTITTGLQIACFLFAIARTARNAGNTMRNSYFVSSPLQLNEALHNTSCGIQVSYARGFFSKVEFSLTPQNVDYVFSRSATNMRLLFTCISLHIILSALNRLLVCMHVHEVRYHFVVFRKDLLLVWEVLLMIATFLLLEEVHRENKVLVDYVATCGLVGNTISNVVPFIELYLSLSLTIVFFTLNILAAVCVRCRENPREKMLREEAKRQEEQQQLLLPPDMHNLRSSSRIKQVGGVDAKMAPSPCGPAPLTAHVVDAMGVGNAAVHSAASGFGPSISRPQTPATLGPEQFTLVNTQNPAKTANEGHGRMPEYCSRATLHTSPPPPFSSPPADAPVQPRDSATEATEELDHKPWAVGR